MSLAPTKSRFFTPFFLWRMKCRFVSYKMDCVDFMSHDQYNQEAGG